MSSCKPVRSLPELVQQGFWGTDKRNPKRQQKGITREHNKTQQRGWRERARKLFSKRYTGVRGVAPPWGTRKKKKQKKKGRKIEMYSLLGEVGCQQGGGGKGFEYVESEII